MLPPANMKPPTRVRALAGAMSTTRHPPRRARGWSQARMAYELRRVAQHKEISVASTASLKTQISRWENGHITPDFYQPLLCELFMVTPGDLGFTGQELPSDPSSQSGAGVALISKREWTRDDLRNLS